MAEPTLDDVENLLAGLKSIDGGSSLPLPVLKALYVKEWVFKGVGRQQGPGRNTCTSSGGRGGGCYPKQHAARECKNPALNFCS
jgi:hypothetical protein